MIPEAADPAMNFQEYLLSQVLCIRHVVRVSQAQVSFGLPSRGVADAAHHTVEVCWQELSAITDENSRGGLITRDSQRRGLLGFQDERWTMASTTMGKARRTVLDLYILLVIVFETKTSYDLAGCAN